MLLEDELRYHLGLTNFTSGKGKVNLTNFGSRNFEFDQSAALWTEVMEDDKSILVVFWYLKVTLKESGSLPDPLC
ncbi:unnamed protein product [Malus baccata var. baccata]